MNHLTALERELVALGSAMGSNCVPCIEYHIPEAKSAGLTDPQIAEAIRLADRVRQVPARKTLQAALKLLSTSTDDGSNVETGEDCWCGANADDEKNEASKAAQPCNMMMRMMSKMINTYSSHGQSAGMPNFAEKKPSGNPAKSAGCGCG
jgi:4-carboxymuconolactone decarboxylase